MVVEMDSDSFDTIIQSGKLVLVDFWAEWCGYCKLMEPIIEGVAAKHHDRILVVRMNVDENPEMAARFGIEGLPVFMIFSRGEPVCSLLGTTPRLRFESWVEECLDKGFR